MPAALTAWTIAGVTGGLTSESGITFGTSDYWRMLGYGLAAATILGLFAILIVFIMT